MRRNGLIGIAILVLLVGAAWYFLTDALFERQIEDVGGSVVGAKVEIDNFELSLTGLSVSLDRLQVTDPNDTWTNLFETGRVAFEMEAGPLIRKKVVVNEVAIEDVRLGTKRETDGKIDIPEEEPGWVDEVANDLKAQVADAPVLNLGILKQKVNIDSLMATFDIQAVGKIDSARANAETTFQRLQQTLAEFKPQDDLKKIETEVQQLQQQEISNLPDLLRTVDRTKKLIGNLNAIKKDVEAKKSKVSFDLKQVSASFTHIDDWVRDDFNSVKSKANIGEFSAQNVGKMLFGDVVVRPTVQVLQYVELARKYMPVAQQFLANGKQEKPPRLKGQDIRFPIFNNKPEFLLEKLTLSAATNQADTSQAFSVRGDIAGVTNQPRVYGQPLIFGLSASPAGRNSYEVSGSFDHTQETPVERIRIKASGVRLGKIELPQRNFLPNSLFAETSKISADFGLADRSLEFKVNLTANPVEFRFAEDAKPENAISRITHEVFSSIQTLSLTAGISGPPDGLRLQISSNIDNVLAQRIKSVLGKSVKQARAEIRRRIDEKVEPRKRQALQFVADNRARITGEIDKVSKLVDEQLAVVEAKKKELEGEIEKKKDEGVKDAKDKLKGLFKKKN